MRPLYAVELDDEDTSADVLRFLEILPLDLPVRELLRPG
jgi:hypothetical protein